MSWNSKKRIGRRFQATKYVSLPDHCKYKYLLDIRGYGWSGRLKFLLYTQRPIFFVERNLRDYSSDGLEPFVHYIPVKEDLSDLEEMYQWAESHPLECKKIATNALRFAKKKYDYDNLLADYKDIVLKFIN